MGAAVAVEERENAAAELVGLHAHGGSVHGVGNAPEFFGAASRVINHFGMAAGKRVIFFIADEKSRKGASRDSLFRRNFGGRETCRLFAAVDEHPRAGSKQGLA